MRDLFRSGSAAQFLLHGNVFDVVPSGGRLLSLTAFLEEVMFSSYDVVLRYDRSRGVRATRGAKEWTDWLTGALGPEANPTLLREPAAALELVDRFLLRTLNLQALGETGRAPRRIAVVIEFAEFVVPRGDALQLGGPFAANVVKVLGWANDPVIAQANIVTVLVSEGLHDLNESVVDNPHSAELHVPLPDGPAMVEFVRALVAGEFPTLATNSDVSVEVLGERLTGLSRVGARTAIALALRNGKALTSDWLTRIKKNIIERECQGLLDFIESPFTLEHVAGLDPVKAWLREDAALLRRGALHALPMGYLIAGRIAPARPSSCSAGRESSASRASCSRISGIAGWAPPSRTWRRSSPCSGRSVRWSCSWTKPIRRPDDERAATATAGFRDECTRCWRRRCRIRATAAGSSGCLPHPAPISSRSISSDRAASTSTSRSSRPKRPRSARRCSWPLRES
jgi:hypothetical protein